MGILAMRLKRGIAEFNYRNHLNICVSQHCYLYSLNVLIDDICVSIVYQQAYYKITHVFQTNSG